MFTTSLRRNGFVRCIGTTGSSSTCSDTLEDKKYVSEFSRWDAKFKQPDIAEILSLPRRFREVSNETVFELAIQGHHGATRERLVREIMRVENCRWVEARTKVEEMNRENDKGAWLALLPYRLGVGSAFVSALVSLPMVFHKETAIWFAREVVNMPEHEIPVDEMTTFWSVGSFSWGYMEPLLGTLSFVLLAAQFMRANMQHMGLHPYTDKVNLLRASRLVKAYPQYDKNTVMEFSLTDKWHK